MLDGEPLLALLLQQIEAGRPITIADYMAAANRHYYATRDPLGVAGDFTTAPEISQMFGELVGIWIADLWMRANRPAFDYVELGPGRGTLAADALRTMASFGCTPVSLHLVETSPILTAAQTERHPTAFHHLDISGLPDDRPLIIIANEFFDALPIHQYIAADDGWRELVVGREDDRLIATAGPAVKEGAIPERLKRQPLGTIIETAPAAAALMADCASRIARQDGAMLVIDYGYIGPASGDTFQAVKAHDYIDPFANPGETDLTAHVDFTALATAAHAADIRAIGPARQGDWLYRLGIDARCAALASATPARAAELIGQRNRLVSTEEMGELFRILAIHSRHWPIPEGFFGESAPA